jgi:hypothetical protein
MADRSGVMAFLLKRPVFQLEGLVNTPGYLRDLAADRVDNGYLLDRGITVFILSEIGERPRDSLGCMLAPVAQSGLPPVRLRLCPEDLLRRAEYRDGVVTIWQLRRRTP